MRIIKAVLAIFSASLLVAFFATGAGADTFNKLTVVTFNQPIEIPGQTLAAGTYTIKLAESFSNRHIVQIFNADRSRLIATVLAIPNERLTLKGETVMKFAERPGNAPQALKAWFYPGDTFGQEFVYPKARAIQLAQVTHESIPAVENVPSTVEEMKTETIVAVTPEQTEVPIEQVIPLPAQTTPAITPASSPAPTLPKTATEVPLIAMLGIAAISLAVILRRLARCTG